MSDPAIDRFFGEADSWWSSYTHQSFSFFGIKEGDLVKVVLGRVRLQSGPASKAKLHQFGQFVAGVLPVAPRESAVKTLVSELRSGEPTTPIRGLRFVLPTSQDCGLMSLPPTRYHAEGMSAGKRLSVFPIWGGYRPAEMSVEEIDWLLKASPKPYDSLAEMLVELSLPNQLNQRCAIDVIAANAVEVLGSSAVANELATLGLWLRKPTKRSVCRLNFRVVHKGQVIERGSFSGSELSWTLNADVWTGTIPLKVPHGAVVQCFAIHGDQVHHVYWAVDPSAFQNPRLATFETVDSSLQVFQRYLFPIGNAKGGTSHQFEAAVSWLIWACGFAPVHLALADEAKNGPDILAMSPGGGVAVVECTLGLLKAESKLAKVSRRALTVREALAKAGFPNVNVLPVIVTAFPKAEVQPELDAATEAGVLVLTRENLQNMYEQTRYVLNGDATFKRGLDTLAEAQSDLQRRKDAARQAGPTSPLGSWHSE